MSPKPKPASYVLTIRATPSSRAPDVPRLRRLLKVLGRIYGFKCTAIREVQP